eukprot:767317-Hanusia_phi.AAC.4
MNAMNAPVFITLPDPRCINFFVPRKNAKRKRFDLDPKQKLYVTKQGQEMEKHEVQAVNASATKGDNIPKASCQQDRGNLLLLSVLKARQLRSLELSREARPLKRKRGCDGINSSEETKSVLDVN